MRGSHVITEDAGVHQGCNTRGGQVMLLLRTLAYIRVLPRTGLQHKGRSCYYRGGHAYIRAAATQGGHVVVYRGHYWRTSMLQHRDTHTEDVGVHQIRLTYIIQLRLLELHPKDTHITTEDIGVQQILALIRYRRSMCSNTTQTHLTEKNGVAIQKQKTPSTYFIEETGVRVLFLIKA